MTTERRYDENEIADIFAYAALAAEPTRAPAATGGLTLEELQAIGREVGLPAERIAAAAAHLAQGRAMATREAKIGMPVATGRILELPRAITEREWAQLVTELREVFGATGAVMSDGDSRQWSNGNLQARVEPSIHGYRLRLSTRKSDASVVNRLGLSGVVLGSASAVGMLWSGEPASTFTAALVMVLLGGGAFAFNAVRLPRWAAERERQMDHVLERIRAIMGTDDR